MTNRWQNNIINKSKNITYLEKENRCVGIQRHILIKAERVRALKETQEGVDSMCEEMDKIYQEGIAIGERRGLKIGEQKAKKEMARCLVKMGIPEGMIRKVLQVDTDLLDQWFR